jgi:hypothetical protein
MRSMSKAKTNANGKPKRSGKQPTAGSAKHITISLQKPEKVDKAQVRENINNRLWASAEEVAVGIIDAARAGQVVSARYLFEAIGLYPASEQTENKREADSLALTLLRRLGLPTEPLIDDEEDEPQGLTGGWTQEKVPTVDENDSTRERGESAWTTSADVKNEGREDTVE